MPRVLPSHFAHRTEMRRSAAMRAHRRLVSYANTGYVPELEFERLTQDLRKVAAFFLDKDGKAFERHGIDSLAKMALC